MEINIVEYSEQYRDDMLFCYLSAKDVIGKHAPEAYRIPSLKDDMLNINAHYFDKGDKFWLALDSDDRVVGMLGIKTLNDREVRLQRFFIKPECKRTGVGSRLLAHLENYAREQGADKIYTRFAVWYEEAEGFYKAKGFVYKGADMHVVTMVKDLE